MSSTINDMIQSRRPIIYDGAMGTQIQKSGVTDADFQGHEGCNEILNITRRDLIGAVHAQYLEAGANVIETNTFGGNRFKLAEYDLDQRTVEINRAAASIARGKADEVTDHPAFVSGSIGPTGFLLSGGQDDTPAFEEFVRVFGEQAAALIEGGADIILLETMQDLLELRAALIGVRQIIAHASRPVCLQVQVTMDAGGHMLMGSDIDAFLGCVANFNPDIVGLNCSTGPSEMMPRIQELVQKTSCAVSMIPNAGMPENVDGVAVYKMSPTQFASQLTRMVEELGVAVVGGCCGTTPEHIRALADALQNKKVSSRESVDRRPWIGTGIHGTSLQRSSSVHIIGERLNTQGSRKTKELVLANAWDDLFFLAQEQESRGSRVLDLCVAVNERNDEAETMSRLVSFLAQRCTTGFCMDSTDSDVFAHALAKSPGSVLINSINLEQDGRKARTILELAQRYACPVIALPIDDTGMAKSLERKIELSQKLIDLACGEFSLPHSFLFIDPLVFTLATGDRESAGAAVESLKALEYIKKQWPDVQTVMGVSNVSFGLKARARRIMNNIMLDLAAEAGLSAAIFNPLHRDETASYEPKLREAAEDLLLNRHEDALTRYIQLFEQQPQQSRATKATSSAHDLPADKRLRGMVLNRDKRQLEPTITTLLKEQTPEDILNKILLPAMAEVGEKMAQGELILPFVLQSAEVMQEALAILEPHLQQAGQSHKGSIILATVYGDIHDIGKNLVGSILKNQGYKVIDLGKQVPVEKIIETVRSEKPDAVGLSALLVTTSREMANCVVALHENDLSLPVLIGGAAVSRSFAERIELLENGESYAGGVYFARDAFEASSILKKIKEKTTEKVSAMPRAHEESRKEMDAVAADDLPEVEAGEMLSPPFYGTSDLLTWSADELLSGLDKTKLFKGYWRGGNLPDREYQQTVQDEFEPVFQSLCEEIIRDNLVQPRAVYGYFPVFTEDTTLVIVDPGDFHTELASFTFPRVERKKGRSLADYFYAHGDLIAVQAVTIGPELGKRASDYFQKDDNYSRGFYLNATGSCLTENLASRVTREIQRGLFLGEKRGKRYSFGYPGLPGPQEQGSLFALLSVEERLGITLTSGFQMVPEHSTAGIYVHHSQAEYL
ncbi:MAG: homocysteine S-methyltransferase family protein [Chitinivibrionales bacterium]